MTFSIRHLSLAAVLLLATALNGHSQGRKDFNVKNVTFSMYPVSSQTITLGATEEQGLDAETDEFPAHEVFLSGYYIGKTEVTQALWKAVMGDNPSFFPGDQFPVESVSYQDCQTFIRRLNQLTGQQFRLPTEAEWECAARGGLLAEMTKYGTQHASHSLGSYAWYSENSERSPHEVEKKVSNHLYLNDMPGNVAEWCSDWKGPYPEGKVTDPRGPQTGTERICRGGAWCDPEWRCRTSSRMAHEPTYKGSDVGFRLAMTLPYYLLTLKNPEIRGQHQIQELQITLITLTDDETRIDFTFYNERRWWGPQVNSKACLVDTRTGRQYELREAHGIYTKANDHYFNGGTVVKFTLVFPPLPHDVRSVDFIERENGRWNLGDIRLR